MVYEQEPAEGWDRYYRQDYPDATPDAQCVKCLAVMVAVNEIGECATCANES